MCFGSRVIVKHEKDLHWTSSTDQEFDDEVIHELYKDGPETPINEIEEFIYKYNLTFAQKNGVGEFKYKESWIKLNEIWIWRIHFHKMPFTCYVHGNLLRLEFDFLAYSSSPTWIIIWCLDTSHKIHEFSQTMAFCGE